MVDCSKRESQFVLGTAQLGMPYGVANQSGNLDQEQVDAVLGLAWKCGVRVLDTAASYGESELRIGSYMRRHTEHTFRVVSKLSGSVDVSSRDSIVASIEASASRLGSWPSSVLLHNPAHLEIWDQGLGSALMSLKKAGRLRRIGVSTYTPDEFLVALKTSGIDCIQAPISVFDQRLIESGLVDRAREAGKDIFVRSIFLQGLLLMSLAQVELRFGATSLVTEWVQRWHLLLARSGYRTAALALGFVSQLMPDGGLILGCETPSQVAENAELLRELAENPIPKSLMSELADFSAVPLEVCDPRLWPAK